MKQYIGVELVMAKKSTVRELLEEKWIRENLELPDGVDPEQEVYLVGMDGFENKAVIPAEIFEEGYRQTNGMNFGLALEACKMGERIARKGWNGKGQYVFLAHEPDFNTDADLSMYDGLEVETGDVLAMKTAQETFQLGWLASQADMLADDWYIVE